MASIFFLVIKWNFCPCLLSYECTAKSNQRCNWLSWFIYEIQSEFLSRARSFLFNIRIRNWYMNIIYTYQTRVCSLSHLFNRIFSYIEVDTLTKKDLKPYLSVFFIRIPQKKTKRKQIIKLLFFFSFSVITICVTLILVD